MISKTTATAIVQSQEAVKMMGLIGNRAMPEIMPAAWATRSQKKAMEAATVTPVETPATWAIKTTAAKGISVSTCSDGRGRRGGPRDAYRSETAGG